MPKHSKADKVYEAIRQKGKTESSAARIAQTVTGQSLAGGRRPESPAQKARQRIERLRRTVGQLRRELKKD